jgi:hypothetical protein
MIFGRVTNSHSSRQDLFAALLINSERHETHTAFPQIQWRRQIQPHTLSTLPNGFDQHREVLPQELLSCVEDILQLQATSSKTNKSSYSYELSNMQASIESRLAFAQQVCKQAGPVAECCRIAIFITCFLSFTETWANPLIPCRLSDLLLTGLNDSLSSPVWINRRNLQVWLILTGSCATLLNNGCVENLEVKWADLSRLFPTSCSNLSPDEISAAWVESALQDFIYSEYLLQRRLSIPAWSALEMNRW